MAISSAALHAPVFVEGNISFITVITVDDEGNKVPCEIRLISLPSNYMVNKTTSGVLKSRVAPGKYVAEAYLAGYKLNSTQFSVKSGESVVKELTVNTIYFIHFNALPATDSQGNVGYVYVVGVIKKSFQAFTKRNCKTESVVQRRG